MRGLSVQFLFSLLIICCRFIILTNQEVSVTSFNACYQDLMTLSQRCYSDNYVLIPCVHRII